MSEAEVGLNDQERKRINIALSRHFPDISVRRLRRTRNKPGYKNLLSNAFQGSVASKHPETQNLEISPIADQPEGIDNSSSVILDSAVELKQFVIERYQMIHQDSRELSDLISDKLNRTEKGSLFNKEFQKWVSTRIPQSTNSRKPETPPRSHDETIQGRNSTPVENN